MALLKRKSNQEPEAPPAPAAPVEAPQPEGEPSLVVPGASYNVMTSRYAKEQARSLTSIILTGIVAIAIVSLLGTWFTVRGAEASASDQLQAVTAEISDLESSIAEAADTGGLRPEEVARLRDSRVAAFEAATGNEIDYQKVLTDLASFNTQRAWITSVTFAEATASEDAPEDDAAESEDTADDSAQEDAAAQEDASPTSGVVVQVSGRAIDALDVDAWYTAVEARLGYGEIVEDWPVFSGSGGDSEGGLQWSATLNVDNTVFVDAFEQYDLDVDTSTSPPDPEPGEDAVNDSEPADDTAEEGS